MTVDITMIMDRSGSMECIEKQVVISFNDFLLEQKNVEGEATISLIQFDHEYQVNYIAMDLQDAEPLNDRTYRPRGRTALLDAIGRTIGSTKERLSENPDFGGTAKASSDRKVILVITTDGMENASEEYTRKQINSLIKECEDALGWNFIYLAADEAAFAQHDGLGMHYGRSVKVGHGSKAYSHANKIMSKKMAHWRMSGSSEELDFTDAERKEADQQNEG